MRGNKSITVEYKGFNGEDIYDKFSVNTDKVKVSNKDISTIQIYGNGKEFSQDSQHILIAIIINKADVLSVSLSFQLFLIS